MPKVKNQNGAVRMRNWVANIAHEKDKKNALIGVGVQIFLGKVVTVSPDLSVALAGITKLDDEEILLSHASGDLLIPESLRVTKGDTIALVPVAGTNKWWILDKSRNANLPVSDSRFGYNGDRNTDDATGEFAGVHVSVPNGDDSGASVINVKGSAINITSYGGASVNIDGINFKNHRHSNPEGGQTGPAT